MKPGNKNSYKSLSDLEINGKNFKYYSLKKAELNGLQGISKLPKSIKVLLENLLFIKSRGKWTRWYIKITEIT